MPVEVAETWIVPFKTITPRLFEVFRGVIKSRTLQPEAPNSRDFVKKKPSIEKTCLISLNRRPL